MLSILTFVTECFLSAIIKKAGIDPVQNTVSLLFILVSSVAYIIDVKRSSVLRKYEFGLTLGYVLRVFFLLFDRYGQSIYRLPNSGVDTEWFYNMAAAQATGASSHRSGDFIGLFRMVFSFVGTNRLFGQFIVVLFSIAGLTAITFAIDKIRISVVSKVRAITLLCSLPNFAILSSVFLRESIVMMFVAVSFLFFFNYYLGGSFVNLIICFASIASGMIFHAGVVGLMIGYLIVLFLHRKGTEVNSLSLQNTVLTGLFGFSMLVLYVRFRVVFFTKLLSIYDLSGIANTSTAGGSSYAAYVGNSNSIANIIIYTVPRCVYFLFSPFPWQFRGLPDIIAFCFSGLYYLYVIALSLKYIIHSANKNRVFVINLLIILFCAVFVFAWGVSSTGTAARHRDKLIPIFAVLHAFCSVPKKQPHSIQQQ